MKAYKDVALKEAKKVLDFVIKDELTNDDKDLIVKESIENFDKNINPGWLDYRKSVSTNSAFVEWADSELLNVEDGLSQL